MKILIKILFFVLFAGFLLHRQDVNTKIEETFTAFTIDAKTANIEFYWKNGTGENFGSLENLKQHAAKQGKKLRFAMNSGMYQEDRKPAGCRNALYLDGFVSRMYAPEENITQTDGNFGVIIGITE